MRRLKALGERIVSRDFERQVAELHIRVAVLNRFTALGTPVMQRVALVCPGKGQARALQPNSATAPLGGILGLFEIGLNALIQRA